MEELSDRFRLVLPDLPLHGDSEDRPRHPYTRDWLVEVLAGFIREACGPRPLVGGHDIGALLVAARRRCRASCQPERLVLLPSALHRRTERERARARSCAPPRARAPSRASAALAARGATLAFRPARRRAAVRARQPRRARPHAPRARRPAAQRQPRPRLGQGRAPLARRRRDTDLLDAYRHVDCPTLLLWADEDPAAPGRDRRGAART